MIPSFAIGIIERNLNHYLLLDPESKYRIAVLTGKVVVLESKNFNLRTYFIFDGDKIRLANEYAAPVDVTLRGSMFDFFRLKINNDTAAVFSSNIEITGDTETAEQFKKLFSELDIDWEEQLSHVSGDFIAHQVGNFIRSLCTWAKNSSTILQQDVTEYLQEEARLLPTRIELEDFFASVDQVRNDVERIEKRILRLHEN